MNTSEKKHNWKRFLCPREGRFSLADGGYLPDPDSTWGAALSADIKTWEAIGTDPCLVLLGEPGIGKTEVIRNAQAAAQHRIENSDERLLAVDLRAVGSEQRLLQKIFESAEFCSWRESILPELISG